MTNRDLQLLKEIVDIFIPKCVPEYVSEAFAENNRKIEHPLDEEVEEMLNEIKKKIRDEDEDYRIFYFTDEIKNIWKLIIQKSIKCLRYFDSREPYLENQSKHPVAYGVEELSKYFDKYIKFESMLYGGGKYYRDHVVHVFRVWLLGLECLLDDDGIYLKRIVIQRDVKVNSLEKISIWSMIALTHDLGYPLEKALGIIDQTKDMMKSFIANPSVSMDLSFNGIQNNMNDFVVRFISSKMHEADNKCPREDNADEEKRFVARLQPKYYFKFQKSLERYNHGILSTIIIYKLLRYFLESDFSINEDYLFDKEEARQFYIRREILRTIASHTCHDVYHLDMLSFAFLLIVVDDAQEWGRKRISELYVNKDSTYEFLSIVPQFDIGVSNHGKESIKLHSLTVKEKFSFKNLSDLQETLLSLYKQCKGYKEIFRDGQDTTRRNFTFKKNCEIVYEETKQVVFCVDLLISNDDRPRFTIATSCDAKKPLETFNLQFLNKLFCKSDVQQTRKDENGRKFTYEIADKSE